MQTLYPYFLTIHLLCAIVFLGFIFTDVVLLSLLKKTLGENAVQEMERKRGIKIMPVCVLLFVLTGGAMLTNYVNFDAGFWETSLQKLLMIKIILALVIVGFVLNALTFRLIIKKPNPLGKLTHKIVLVLGFFIVILAKFAFFV